MGGKSSSQQNQTTHSSNTQTSYVDNSDHSDNSRVDIWQDKSDNRQYDGVASGATVGGDLNITDGGAFDFARDAMREASDLGRESLITAENVSTQSIKSMESTSQYAIDGAYDMGKLVADTVRDSASDSMRYGNAAAMAAIDASNTAMERNAALIQTTALGGQDLVIDMATKIGIAAVAVVGVGVVVMVLRSK